MIDAAAFRIAFPEFADAARYTDATVSMQIAIAGKRLNVERWTDLYDHGCGLFVAHAVALAGRGTLAAPQTAKAVDKVSASYDTAAVSLIDGGYWNQTSYGVQFLQLARLVGMGGIQL